MPITAISERARQFKKFVYRSITIPLLLLILFAGILSWRVLALVDAARWVDHSDKVIAQANYTLLLVVDEESGLRGYFVNYNPVFLDRYRSSALALTPAFGALSKMVAVTPEQELRVGVMRSDYGQWETEASIELNESLEYPSSYRAYFDQSKDKLLMAHLRSEFESFISTENTLRDQREATAENATADTLVSSAALAILFGLCLGLAWIRQTTEFANRYEEALNVSARNLSLLSATLMSIGDAVLVTDPRGKVLQMNRIAEELTGWTFSDAYGLDADTVFKTVDRTTRVVLESPIKRAASEGNAVSLSDQAILIRRDDSELSIDDTCSPIRDETGLIAGVILVFRDVTERKRAEAELTRLYDREHRIAENLQRSLLSKPDPKLFPMLDIQTFYQSAWAEAKVGGDYFDIIGLREGYAGLIVGDVSGKGLKAASRTAEMKFTLRAYLQESMDVTSSVRRLNEFVCRSQSTSGDDNSFFLCLTAIVADPSTGKASICVCGSEPPIIVRASGVIEEIKASGPPIGIFEDSVYEPVEITLGMGDLVVISTDGITEARNGHDFLGNEGLAKIAFAARSMKSLADVGTKIIIDVKAFASDQLSDDVCLMLLRKK